MIILFRLIDVAPDSVPIVNQYADPKSHDLATDPMEVSVAVDVYDDSGKIGCVDVLTTYAKADWTGEVIA